MDERAENLHAMNRVALDVYRAGTCRSSA